MNTKTKKQISVTMDIDVLEKLEAKADLNARTISGEIRFLIFNHIKE